MPEQLMERAAMPRQAFLVYLGHFAGAAPNHPLIELALQELGLADREAYTAEEMRTIEQAVATLVQAGLESVEDPRIQTYARIMRHAHGMIARHAKD